MCAISINVLNVGKQRQRNEGHMPPGAPNLVMKKI